MLAALQLGLSAFRLGSVCLEPWTPFLSQNIAPPLVPRAPRFSARIPRRLRCLLRRHLSGSCRGALPLPHHSLSPLVVSLQQLAQRSLVVA
eukprot:5710560-Prymnesium_polylepis.1